MNCYLQPTYGWFHEDTGEINSVGECETASVQPPDSPGVTSWPPAAVSAKCESKENATKKQAQSTNPHRRHLNIG